MKSYSPIVTSRLMKNYAGVAPISHRSAVATATDEDGAAMFLSVGADGHLRYFKAVQGSDTGWEATDLSGEMQPGWAVALLATAQSPSGKPILAAVMQGPGEEQDVRVTQDFHQDPVKAWRSHGQPHGGRAVQLAAGAGIDGDVYLCYTSITAEEPESFLVAPDGTHTAVPAPVNARRVLSTAICRDPVLENDPAIHALLYTLYEYDSGTTDIRVQSLPEPIYNHTIQLQISPTAFGITPNAAGEPELLVADTRAYHLPPALQRMGSSREQVAQGAVAIGDSPLDQPVASIQALRGGDATLDGWFHTQGGRLFHAASDEQGRWQAPLEFQAQVARLAAWKDPRTLQNHVFSVDLGDELTRYSQDAVTTRWREHQILTIAPDGLTVANGYATQIQFTDEDGVPLANSQVTVSASELTELTINHQTYYVGTDADRVDCETDATGSLVIEGRAQGLSAAALRFSGDLLAAPLTHDPTQTIDDQLSPLDVQALGNAQMQTEQYGVTVPLFPKADPGRLQGAHQALQALLAMRKTLPSGNFGRLAGNAARRAVGDTPPVDTWMLDFTGDTPAFSIDPATIQAVSRGAQGDALHGSALPGGILHDLHHSFGDLFHSIKHGLIHVTHLVITKLDDGFEVLIHATEGVFHTVIHFAEQVWDVVDHVLEKIGAELEQLVRWLGFLFMWTDILRTHEALKTLFTLTTSHTVQEIDQLADESKKLFEWIEKQVGGNEDLKVALGDHASDRLRAAGKLAGDHGLPHGPHVGWMAHRLTSRRTYAMDLPDLDLGGTSLEALAKDFGQNEAHIFETACHDLASEMPKNFADWSFGQLAEQTSQIVTESVLETAENVSGVAIKASGVLLEDFTGSLGHAWKVPVIAPLYRFITQGKELTGLDLMCLVVAVPTTIGFKEVTGKVPFDHCAGRIAGADSYSALLATLSGQTPAPTDPVAGGAMSRRESLEGDDGATPADWAAAALAFAIGATRGASFIAYSVKEIADLAKALPVKQVASAVKVAFDLGGWTLSVASGGMKMVVLDNQERKDAFAITLANVETTVSVLQVLFPVRDAALLAAERAGVPIAALKPVKVSLAWVESGIGAVLVVYGCLLYVAECAQAGVGDRAKLTQGISAALMKFGQNQLSASYRVLAGVSTTVPDPEIKAVFVVARAALLFSRSVLTIGRGVVSILTKEEFIDY